MDTLVSVGVVISGILISLTHYYALDAFIGMGIALIILISTWKLLKESLYLTLDAVPEHIHLDKLEPGNQSDTGSGKLASPACMGCQYD